MLGAPEKIRVVRELVEGRAVFMFIRWKRLRKPVKTQGNLTHLCTMSSYRGLEQGPGMVSCDSHQDPTRVSHSHLDAHERR